MTDVKPKTVVFCLPGKSFSREFLECWTELFNWCIFNGIKPIISTSYSPNLYYVRNMCLGGSTLNGVKQKPFAGQDYDYIMWIDSDVLFRVDHFKQLLDADKDIVSGVYTMNDNIHCATVETMDHELYKKQGYYDFMKREDVTKRTDLFGVDYTGFGFMLIKKGVFESLEYPWFRPMWFEYGDDVKDFAMEDVSFCQAVKEKGYTVWVNPKTLLGHQKTFII